MTPPLTHKGGNAPKELQCAEFSTVAILSSTIEVGNAKVPWHAITHKALPFYKAPLILLTQICMVPDVKIAQ